MRKLIAGAMALALSGAGVMAEELLPIRIGAAGAVDHAPVFVAVERGIFAAHGLDPEVILYTSGVDMVTGLINGAQDVNVMGSVPYLTGLERGFPLVLIGHLHGDPNRDHYADNQAIVASAAAGVGEGDIAALRGKRIGLPRGTGAEAFLLGVLDSAGIKPEDVELVNLPPAQLATALNQGDVGAIAIWQPWGAQALMQVPGSTLVQAGGCRQCYDPGAIVTTRSVIEGKADALARFMAAFAEAQAFVRANPDEAAAINMRWIQGVELPAMRAALGSVSFDPRISSYTAAMYREKALPFLVGLGRVSAAFAFDPETAIDTRFLAAVEASNPAVFGDLAPIPADRRVY